MTTETLRLRFIYRITTALCIWMVLYILIFPGSWLFGRTKLHNDVIEPFLVERMSHGITSLETITKYKGHSLIHFTHILPAAIWSAAIPFQLHRDFQGSRIHRCIGYIFIASSLLMVTGILIIFKRDLYFEKFFEDLDQPLLPSYYYSIILAVALYYYYYYISSSGFCRNDRKCYPRWIIPILVLFLGVAVVGGTMTFHRYLHDNYFWEIILDYQYLSTAPLIAIAAAYFFFPQRCTHSNLLRLTDDITIIGDGSFGMSPLEFG